VFEIGLTPNRSDAASHLGVARDLAAIVNSADSSETLQLKLPEIKNLPTSNNTAKISINIHEPSACQRYSGLAISGLKVTDSPDWIKNRLKAIGLRPIN